MRRTIESNPTVSGIQKISLVNRFQRAGKFLDNPFTPADARTKLTQTVIEALERPNYALDLMDVKLPYSKYNFYDDFNISIPRRIAMRGYRAI